MSELTSIRSQKIWRVATPFAVAALLIWGTLSAQAAPNTATTYYVMGTSDPAPTTCTSRTGGGFNCASLRSAVIAANANAGWDTIVLRHGATYNLTIQPAGNDDATTGDLNITGHVNFNFGNVLCLQNCGATIQGDAGWADRLLQIEPNIRVDMYLLTLQRGSIIGGWGGAIQNFGILTLTNSLVTHNTSSAGGGIYNHSNGTLNLIDTRLYTNTAVAVNSVGNSGGLGNDGLAYLTNVTIDQNLAAGRGGGMGNDGRLIINGGVISGNLAHDSSTDTGGGIWNTVGGGIGGGLTMTNTLVSGNWVDQGDGSGGGLANATGAMAYLTGVTFTRNSAAVSGSGGGIINWGDLTLDHSSIVTNTGSYGGGLLTTGVLTATYLTLSGNIARIGGGGLFVGQAGRAQLSYSQIKSNNAADLGGGIDNGGGWLSLDSDTLSQNEGQTGGGLYNQGTVWLLNSTFSGNFARLDGGGLYNDNSGLTIYLDNVTVVNNQADSDANGSGEGGGLRTVAGGAVYAANSLIAQNSSLGVNKPDCSGTLSSLGYNLIQSTAGCTISGTLTGNILGQAPKIGPLKDNGGATWTHALLSGSPAIDAGNPGGAFFTVCMANDQRGVYRPIGPRCDIGAYEANRLLYLPLVVR